MDFIEELKLLSANIARHRDTIFTEEATKNAFVLPFLKILGYDIFNPSEVVPEFTADVGIKKGEKVDYAIVRDGKVIMLVECKMYGSTLDSTHESQLYRYFSVTDARIAILTDGVIYRFYTDLEESHKLDTKPFMEFNILDIQEPVVVDLKKLSRSAFDLDTILSAAEELKYTREIKRILSEQIANPNEDFVRFFATRVYSGKLTQAVRDQFTSITKRATAQFISERINERLRSAMTDTINHESDTKDTASTDAGGSQDDSGSTSRIATTEEEMESFYIVKAIAREIVEPSRIAFRDTANYFGILLDDTNRKPICRLYLNSEKKMIGLFGDNKQEDRREIESVDSIFQYADRIKSSIRCYDGKKANVNDSANEPAA